MRAGEYGIEKSGVAGDPEEPMPDVDLKEVRKAMNGAEDEDLSAATEDPAWSLKESGSG